MKLLLYGSNNFSDTLADLAIDCGHEVIGKIDDFATGPGILGSLSTIGRTHRPGEYGMILAIGYNDLAGRWNAWQRVRALGYEFPTLVHPRAYVARNVKLGCGTLIMAAAVVDTRATIGAATVLWPTSCVNHDATIGSNCFLSPQATICGFTKIGNNSFIGAGAVVVDHCQLPANSFIKASSIIKRTPQE
jgi:sugar O-acyltransferase (sialic acid O-acetyltransferase NeuD family)